MRTVQPIPSLIGTVHHQRRRRRRTYNFIVRMISLFMRTVDVVVAMVSIHLAYHVSSLAVIPLLLYGTIDGRATTTSTVRRLRVGIVPFVTICVAFLCYSASTATASSTTTTTTTTTATTTVSSTNDSNHHPPPNYYNIRSLDEYGNAQQLQYAKNAANRNGRRIVILTNMPSSSSSSSSSNSVWILSPITASQLQQQQQRRKSIFASPFHRRRRRHVNDTMETLSVAPTTAPSLRSASSAPAVVISIVHPISVSTSSYMIATGIGGDIHYLLQQLRTYYKYNYERYNMGVTMPSSSSILSSLPVPKVTSILQLLLRQFWDYPNGTNENDDDDYDESGTWLPMGYRQMVQEQSSENNGWGRPLGICGIVLQWHTTQQQYIMTDEFDPTGIVHQPTSSSLSLLSDQEEVQSNAHPTRITCLGPQHELIQKELMNIGQLRQRYNNSKSNGSGNHDNTTTVEEDDTMIVVLQQHIIAVMERVIQNHTVYADNDNNDPSSPQQYQIEILHPPPSSSFVVSSSSSSSRIQHDIHIIQRQQRQD